MRVEVHCINDKGRPLTKSERTKQPRAAGVLQVAENRLHFSKRVSLCARIHSNADGMETLLLPELFDVQLSWMDGDRMRFRGTELVDGAQFAQAWDVEVL